MEEEETLDNEMLFDSSESSALDDNKEKDLSDPSAGRIIDLVRKAYSKASTGREIDETRWIQAYRNYRGIYGPDVQFSGTEKSQVFVKVTKTKVLAAFGQLVDVVFGANKFPIGITETKVPEGISEMIIKKKMFGYK